MESGFQGFLIALTVGLVVGQKCDIPGRCKRSPLVEISIQPSKDGCLNHCKANEICNWYTFNDDGLHLCELYSSCASIETQGCITCITGESTCESSSCMVQGFCQVFETNV